MNSFSVRTQCEVGVVSQRGSSVLEQKRDGLGNRRGLGSGRVG